MAESKEAAKTVEETTKVTKDLKVEMHELNKKIKQSSENYAKASEAMKAYTNGSFKGLGQMITETARLNVDIHKLAQTHKDGYEYLKRKHKEAIEANDKEIEALSKNINKQAENIKAYEERAVLIVKTGQLAKAELEEEYRLLEESLIKNAQYEERVVALRKERDEKIIAISKDTLNKTIQNGAEMQRTLELQNKAAIDKVIEHSGEVIKHTSGAWKGVIDVGAQKEHLKEIEKQYVDYIFGLKDFGEKRMEEYNKQMQDLNLSVDERATIIAQQKAFETQHNKFLAEETQRIGTELAKIEKSSQHMRLDQYEAYAKKTESITKKVNEYSKDLTKQLFGETGMITELTNETKHQIKDLENKLTELETEKNTKLEEAKLTDDERLEKEDELAYEKIELENATTEEQKAKSQERISTLQNELSAEDSINKEFEAKKEELEKKKKQKEKLNKVAEIVKSKVELTQKITAAVGDTAAGAAKALSYGPFLGPILSALVTAAGAVQIGIMTRQLAKFEDGGLLHGKRHTEGGMRIMGSNIEVEGGEYVVNRKSTKKNLGLIDYINSQNKELTPSDINSYFNRPSVPTFAPSPFAQMMQDGGQVPMLPMQSSSDVERLLAGMQQIKLESRVSVTDINTVQENMVKVDEWVGL